MSPRLLVFDLDGTLIDSSLDICNAVNATLEHLGKPTLAHAVIASYIGEGATTLLRRALGNPSPDASAQDDAVLDDALDFFFRYYRIHKLDNTRLYPGVLDALVAIRVAYPGVLMAVLTNKPVMPSRQICDALGVSQFFFQNYGGNSFLTKKPEPQGCQTIIAEARQILLARNATLKLAEIVLIGDSDVDVLTARASGIRSIGCSFGIRPEAMLASKPDALSHAPADWLHVLQQLFA
jgi:phosphoglycolate phosphatase